MSLDDAGEPTTETTRVSRQIMPIAKEGLREILLSTLILGALSATAVLLLHWAVSIPFIIVWLWVISFFRDPKRCRTFHAEDLCAPADGTVTEIIEIDHHDSIGGPAMRIGIFLSLFNVHVNRAPCSGTVRSLCALQFCPANR